MPEAFKHRFSFALIGQMADCFAHFSEAFDREGFVGHASRDLDKLELKQRSAQITQAMQRYLPQDFVKSAEILLASLSPMQTPAQISVLPEHDHLLKGWAIMPMADYAALCGQAHFDVAMRLMYEMTQRFSSEFAIRYLLLNEPERTISRLGQWLTDSSEHVRRLISEGTRPRLPWGLQLGEFVRDPAPILPLLEALKDDPSEYVRRSVANNLNDIAKDHPQLVIELSSRWLKNATKDRTKLVRHACRTLLKQGNPEALALFGFMPANLKSVSLSLSSHHVQFDKSVSVRLELQAAAGEAQQIMLDYVVYHKKANGKLLPKVFKWKVLSLQSNQSLIIDKTHSFKPVTTRKYHEGEHKIAVLINGKEFARTPFDLLR
ncbi:DNA alkylation repair protein [Glaciecola sp. SC05]|uniref:DNA alkylation repair protein n=1 Tax=Glaciecola sp. SC05 TaxID=1987355 RepID=UPI0035287311